jgi:hypothetical protein
MQQECAAEHKRLGSVNVHITAYDSVRDRPKRVDVG